MGGLALLLQILCVICLLIAWDGRPFPKDKPKRWEFMGYALLILSFMVVGLPAALHAIQSR